MAVAHFLVEELLVGQREQRAVAVRLDQDRHQRLALGGRLPGPGEDEFLIGDDFATDAADVVLFAAWRAHQPAIAAADADVTFGRYRFDLARPYPARYFFRVGPGGEDFGRRRLEAALEGEARFGGGLGGHDSSSSSKKAARLDSRSDQNFS